MTRGFKAVKLVHFTKHSRGAFRTGTAEVVDQVMTRAAVFTRHRCALVHIKLAIESLNTQQQ